MSNDCITASAPAKVNLALAVGPREADGMHPIVSWMVTVDLFDELLVTRLPADRLSRYAILWHEEASRPREIDWSVSSDLAVRAHVALETRVGRRLPVQLELDKRIPVGGGLGGGSSDAAAMLLAVNELFTLGLEREELAEVGATLGSDVPFLVHGGHAIVEGRGDAVTPCAETPVLHLVLVFAECACATGEVYTCFDTLGPGPMRDGLVRDLADRVSAGSARGRDLFNDLTPAAVGVAPELEVILGQVSTVAGLPAHLCGSGSSVFVVCDDRTHAEFLAGAIERTHDLPAVATQAVAGCCLT